MDIEAYRLRKKKTVADLADLLGVKEAAVYNYKYGKSKPSYESIEKMLLDGAYLSEIFSEQVQNEVIKNFNTVQNSAPSIPPELSNDPDFQKGLQQSIDAKVSATVKTELEKILKSKGLL